MYNRPFILLYVLLLAFFTSCNTEREADPLQERISGDKLKEDFRVFRKIVEAAHPSLNNYISQNRAQDILDSISATITGSMTLREFYNKLVYFTDKTGCAHTTLSLPDTAVNQLYDKAVFFPFPVILIGNRVLINSDHNAIFSHGTEIISVNDEPIQSVLKHLAVYNAVDGRQRATQHDLACRDFGYQYYKYAGAKNNFFQITAKDSSGEISRVRIDAITLAELRDREAATYYCDPVDVQYSLRIDEEEDYALLRLATLDFETNNARNAFASFLENSFELLSKKPGCHNLIIDLRENDGGYLYEIFLLFSYLAKNPFKEYRAVYAKIKKVPYREFISPQYTEDDIISINEALSGEFTRKGSFRYAYADSLIDEWQPDPHRFRGNVYVITNAAVMSAASYLATLIKNSGTGKIVGVETRGGSRSGNGFAALDYTLPHTGLRLNFPYAKLLYTYASPKEQTSLYPDYVIPDNDSAFWKNNDTQLLYILDSIIKK